MQIIRPNIDIAEIRTLKLGDTFEFTVENHRFGVCIVTSIEEAGKRRWFSLYNYKTGVSSSHAEIKKLNTTLTVDD